MQVKAIKTDIFLPNKPLIEFILKHIGHIEENSILAITSKIVSLSEGRQVPKNTIDKKTLIQKECEVYLGEINYGCHLTIQHGLLVASAGIDESNSPESHYIVYPKAHFLSTQKIEKTLKQKLSLKNLGILITDSRTFPLRKGVTGAALAYSGFKAVKSLIGKKDLFGRQMKMTTINIADALASSAVLLMGEGGEQCPLAIISQAPLEFTNKTRPQEWNIPLEEDLYKPLLTGKIQK